MWILILILLFSVFGILILALLWFLIGAIINPNVFSYNLYKFILLRQYKLWLKTILFII